jgi:hypothetical protein
MDKSKVKDLESYLINLYYNDNDIIGVFLSGSLVDDSYDEYSDVDIRFVVQTTDLVGYIIKSKDKLLKGNRNILFFEPCYFKNALIAHFDNFIKADIFFYTPQMIIESSWLKGMKIIKDTDNFLQNIKEKSKDLSYPVSNEIIEDTILKYFASSHECYRRIKRGEFLYANQLLQNMKSIIISFYDLYNGHAELSWYKAEKRFDNDLIDLLYLNITRISDNLIIFDKINTEFLHIEQLLCNKQSIKRNFENDIYILSYYVK